MSTTETLNRATDVIEEYDLIHLVNEHRDAQRRFLEARRAAAEARRLFKDAVDRREMAELDALAEMEADPDYVPGKNAEARKLQAERWLKDHPGYQRARQEAKLASRNADELEHRADVAEAEVSHIGLQIGARRTELEVIAAFMRGAS